MERLDLGLRRGDLPAEVIGSEGCDDEFHPRRSPEPFLPLFVFREDLSLGRIAPAFPFPGSADTTRSRTFREETRKSSFASVSGTSAPAATRSLTFFIVISTRLGGLELGRGDAVIGKDRAVQLVPELSALLERGNGGDLPLHLLVRGRQPHLRGLREQDFSLDQGVHRLLPQVERLGHLRGECGPVHLPVRLLEVGNGPGQIVRRDRLSAHGGGHVPVPFGVGADSPPDEGQRDEGEDDLDGPGAGVAAEYGEHGEEVLLSMGMKVRSNVPF